MKPWKAICAALVIFAAGLATGIMVGRETTGSKTAHVTAPAPPPFRSDRRKDYLEKLDKELKLTSDQRKQIEGLLTASQERIQKLWEPVSPKVHDEYHHTREEINALLTSDQQELFKQMRARREKERHPEGSSREKDGALRTNTNNQVLPK